MNVTDLDTETFQTNFGGRNSVDEEKWLARKYGSLEVLKQEKPVERKKIAGKPSGTRKKPPGRPPKYDRREIQRLYQAGRTVPQIADEVEAHPDTVRDILKSLRIYEPNRDKTGGKGKPRRRSTECAKGHTMSDAIITKDKSSGREKRECRTCRNQRERQRKYGTRRSSGGSASTPR